MAGYTGVGISGKSRVCAKVDKDDWNNISFINTEESEASIILTAYDDSGAVIATQTITLNGYAKEIDEPGNIFTQDISSATYISYSSDRDIVAFQLNGVSDGMMLDGLPGM
jgi:hypothetical protein